MVGIVNSSDVACTIEQSIGTINKHLRFDVMLVTPNAHRLRLKLMIVYIAIFLELI